ALAPSTSHLSPPCSFSNHPATTEIYTLSLHDALPISRSRVRRRWRQRPPGRDRAIAPPGSGARSRRRRPAGSRRFRMAAARLLRSEEHTSEFQSRENLVCRLLLEKKKKKTKTKEHRVK